VKIGHIPEGLRFLATAGLAMCVSDNLPSILGDALLRKTREGDDAKMFRRVSSHKGAPSIK
jgi:hypothetical protein